MERTMTVTEAYKNFWKNAFKMKGRARRKEYWTPTLLHILLMIIVNIIAMMIDSSMDYDMDKDGPFSTWSQIILGLALFIPAFTVTARRLQDININDWWALLPNFGGILIVILGLAYFILLASSGNINETGIIIALLSVLAYVIMGIVFFVFTLLDGNAYTNKFGPDPKGREYRRN